MKNPHLILAQKSREIGVVEEMLRCYVNYSQKNWVRLLPQVEFNLNNTVSTATGYTPFFAERGDHPLTPVDYCLLKGVAKLHGKGAKSKAVQAATELSKQMGMRTDHRGREYLEHVVSAHQHVRDTLAETRMRMTTQADRRRRTKNLRPGDQVYLDSTGINLDIYSERPSKKLNPLYCGPFEILERVGPVSYLLKLPASHKNLHPVFHISKLRPISDSGFRGLRRTKLPTIPDQEYEVERILDNRFKRDKEQFLVKWKYYPETDSTWEPIENLKNSKAIVNAFRREQDASSYDA